LLYTNVNHKLYRHVSGTEGVDTHFPRSHWPVWYLLTNGTLYGTAQKYVQDYMEQNSPKK